MQKSMDSRFLKKILTDTEIAQVGSSDHPDATLWSLWACKEAAYKVLKKQTGDAAFVPHRWSVCFRRPLPAIEHQSAHLSAMQSDNRKSAMFATGDVSISEKKSIFFYLFSSLSYVHCLAADHCDVLDKVIWRVDVLPGGQEQKDIDASVYARLCLAHALSGLFRYDQKQITIFRAQEKNGELQPPAVYLDGVKKDIDISLSHDGQFVAYAFLA